MATCAYMSIHECKEVTLIYKSISAFPGVGAMMCRKLVQWRSICAWFCSNGSSVNTSSIPHSRLISVAASWMRWMQQVLIWRQPWRTDLTWFDSVSFWFHWRRDSKSCRSDTDMLAGIDLEILPGLLENSKPRRCGATKKVHWFSWEVFWR